MPKYIGSRLVGVFSFNDPVVTITFGVTGFSVSGGDRNMIDATTGADSRRQVLAGLAEPITASVNFIYQGEIASLDAALTDCASGSLVIRTATDSGDCALTSILGNDEDPPVGIHVYCTGYSIEGELDGVISGTAEFTKIPNAIPAP